MMDGLSAFDVLEFYRASGVDVALGDEPVDRFALSRKPKADAPPAGASTAEAPPQRFGADRPSGELKVPLPPLGRDLRRTEPAQPIARPTAVPLDPQRALDDARTRAAQATTLDELQALLESFEGCGLKATAKRLVFEDGARDARLMFVGEAPGSEEDEAGVPFVGRSGRLLDRMLAAIGIARPDIYIANVVPWRPPGNRTPTPQETEICKPFIWRQIELVAPDILVPLGGPAMQALTGAKEGILRMRGKWMDLEIGGRRVRVLPTVHPAYLLRTPLAKRQAWRDMLAIKSALSGPAR